MKRPISVPASFPADFEYFCDAIKADERERFALRQAVREDFDQVGGWVHECAAVYRFIWSNWKYMPAADILAGYLRAWGVYLPDDVVSRLGLFALARLCALQQGPIN